MSENKILIVEDDANLLTSSSATADYEEEFVEEFMKIVESHNMPKPEIAKLGSNWILGEVNRIKNDNNIDTVDFRERVSPERLVRLTDLVVKGSVSGTSAKQVFEEMFNTGKDAADIVAQRGLSQISDTQEIKDAVRQVMTDNPQALTDFKAGKEAALKFLVGQVMKATKGRANPKLVNELLKKKLEEE